MFKKYFDYIQKYTSLSNFLFFKRNPPLISVVMPAYNSGAYIREAIDSILCQTYSHFELIIINDASTDSTLEIIKSYSDPRIRLIDNPQNLGVPKSLNLGLAAARGVFIARMDSDDISMPERFATQVDFLNKHPEIGVVGSWFYFFGGEWERVDHPPTSPGLPDLTLFCPISHPAVMMRSEVLRKYNFAYNERYGTAQDMELWTRMMNVTRFANIPKTLLWYREHPKSATNQKRHMQAFNARIIKQKAKKYLGTKEVFYFPEVETSSLLNFMKSLPRFHFLPADGGIDAALLASSTMAWFDKHSIEFQLANEAEVPEILVCGGYGKSIEAFLKRGQCAKDLVNSVRKIVILPTIFNCDPKLIGKLDGRFTIFCSDYSFYNYLSSLGTAAEIYNDHDMVFRLFTNIFYKKSIPTKPLQEKLERAHRWASRFSLHKQYMRGIKILQGKNFSTDADLFTLLGKFSSFETREDYDAATQFFLNFLYHHDQITTNNLHIGVASAMLGIDTTLIGDGSSDIYKVWMQSMQAFPHVTLKINLGIEYQ